MIKNFLFSILIIATLFSLDLFARSSGGTFLLPKDNNGLGVALGAETGINYKTFTNKKDAYSATFAQTSGKNDYAYFHIDKLFHDHMKISTPEISLYYGLGASGKVGFEDEYGVRAPLGATYIFRKFPFDIFVEIAPTIIVSPETKLEFIGFFGTRVWF